MSKNRKKKIFAIVASCVAVGVIAISLTGMAGSGGRGGDMEEETSKKTVVEVLTPTRGNIVVSGSFVGTVEPGQQVTVYPKAAGEVLEVNFKVGDTVEAGDVLMEIDSKTLRNTIAQTQAGLNSAQAKTALSLEMAKQDQELYNSNLADGYNANLASAEANVISAENGVDTAAAALRTAQRQRRDFINDGIYPVSMTSMEGMVDEELIKDQLRDAVVQAELTLEKAQAALETAKNNLEITKKSLEDSKQNMEDGVKMAELNADMTQTQLQLQQLQDNLKDYSVTTPISGTIEQCNVDPYDMVSSQTAVYVVSNKDLFTVSFSVAESALTYMHPGNRITLEKDGSTCAGTISEVSNMVDSKTGLYTVKATVENPPFEMRSGSTIKLYADTQKAENEIMIPIDCVYYDSGSPYVYVFKDNTAVKTMIETGISDAQYIQVKSGLTLSDELIVTWSASLFDGAEVYLPGTAPQEDAEESVPEEPVTESTAEDGGDAALSENGTESGDAASPDNEAEGDAA